MERLAGRNADGVCDECEKEGLVKLRRIAAAVEPSADFGAVVSGFKDRVSEYRVPHDKWSPILGQLLQAVMTAASQMEPINNERILALLEIMEQHQPEASGMDVQALAGAAGILNARNVIENWKDADPPFQNCAGLMLSDGELCHFEENGRLLEQRSRREYLGGSQGVSISLARGVRYHVGAFKGTAIDTTYLTDCGGGTLHVTSKRICFTGSQQSASIPWARVINISAYEDGLAIHRTGANPDFSPRMSKSC